MSFNLLISHLLFYNIFNKDTMIYDHDCTRQHRYKKKSVILPNELIILIYKYADNNTKFKLLQIFYWLKDVYLQCYNINCTNKAKYVIHFKLLPEKCRCNINKKHTYFTNIICSLNCNQCLLLNYHDTNQSKYLFKLPLKLHTYSTYNTYTRWNKYDYLDTCYNKKCVICLNNFYHEKINIYGFKLLN